jgi:small subunit ribosomal protein S13
MIMNHKHARQTINQIYGIGNLTTTKLIGTLKLHPLAKNQELLKKKYSTPLQHKLLEMRVEFRLRLIIFTRLIRLLSICCYRGIRIAQFLPTKGQRTHANGKTLNNQRKNGKFFPFPVKTFGKKIFVKQSKNIKTNKKSIVKKKPKVSSKQKAKIKAKNKAKAKAKKKAKK